VPSVIQYPTGRFELQGDGITTPYRWVWIPNPPPVPPAAPPAPRVPAPVDPAPSRQSELYRWVDDEGVANWTDGWDSVPQKYRAQARRKAAR
jgi:hypothetical protein